MVNFMASKDANINRYRKEVTELYKLLEKEIATTEVQLSEAKYYQDSETPGEVYRELQEMGRRI